MNQDPKHCPFCGGTRLKWNKIIGLSNIKCLDCGASTGNKDTGYDALLAWNMRSSTNEKRRKQNVRL